MKKVIKSFLFGLLALLLALSITSCADEVKNVKTEPTRKDVLLDYAVFQDYKMTEEEVENSLVDFLTTGNESKGLSPSSFAIKKINDSTVTFDGKCASKALTSTEQDDILFSVYEVENQTEEKSGFAITSNDKRVGEVLCYIEEGEFSTDISDNPGMTIFAVCLNDYINRTQELWDEITDEDIEALKEEYGITDDDIRRAKEKIDSSKASYSYGSWRLTRGNKNKYLIKTHWAQEKQFNDAIEAVYGQDYPAGCVAISTAQLMAYHEWPQKYISSDLKTLKNKWASIKNWNGVYDWKSMKSDSLNPQIGALIYDIGKGVDMDYDFGGSSSSNGKAAVFLYNNGYDVASDSSGGLFENLVAGGTIATSIDNNRPVLVRADSIKTPKTFNFLWWTITYGYSYSGGHSWLIDGYYQMQRNVTVKRKILFWTITTNSTETLQYVHCNYGWNDDNDDWYLSGVYANNLQYNISLWCNIYPKK